MDKKIIFFLGTVLAFFLKADFAFALEILPEMTLPEFTKYIFNFGVGAAVIIAGIAIAFGGIYYLISFARGKFKDEGKEWIKAGVTGLLIAVCAYMIANTINPDLVMLKFPGLPGISLDNPLGNLNLPSNVDITAYKQIPLGADIENLLTAKMDCFAFDAMGNPIPNGEPKREGNDLIATPTYTKHDRADCLLLLLDGAQKKAQLSARLSDEIIKLMSTCSCKGKCKNKTSIFCTDPNNCYTGDQGNKDSCIANDGTTGDCCEPGIKEKIEHGPIEFGATLECDVPKAAYKGLDEFRCDDQALPVKQCSGIAGLVEDQDKNIKLNKWGQLTLLQQIIFFKEKTEELKQKIETDKRKLQNTANELNRCYLALPYADLLKTYKHTDQSQKIVLIQKSGSSGSDDSATAEKYCKGFNYANSSCYKKCNDACPDTSQWAMDCYGQCEECEDFDFECLARQNRCIENCFGKRPCTLSKDNSSQIYEQCILSCRNDCASECSKKYLGCSEEFKECQDQCQSDSQCILEENQDQCLFRSEQFLQCASQITDKGNTDFCIQNAYACKSGSDQYAGYSDCSTASQNSQSANQECPKDQFSASFFYKNPDCQKCSDPGDPPKEGSACYSKVDTKSSCLKLCPETTKCPASSLCPDCPCDKTEKTVSFSILNSSLNQLQAGANVGLPGSAGEDNTISKKISAYRIVGPQCNDYSYNDDPLNFYCLNQWWNDPNKEGTSEKPIGEERVCQKNGEIPVGQTVDDAKKWAEKIIKTARDSIYNTEEMINHMKKIGEAKKTDPEKNYCKCDAKYETGKPICNALCNYVPPAPVDADGDGNQDTDVEGNLVFTDPYCSLTPCAGNPCDQMIKWLFEVWNKYKTLKNDYINFYVYMVEEGRSDVLKELTYSRKSMNDCSVRASNFGVDTRIFSCTRIEDELMPVTASLGWINKDTNEKKFVNYCYGKELGNLTNRDLTDNWFCCDQWSNSPALRQQPK